MQPLIPEGPHAKRPHCLAHRVKRTGDADDVFGIFKRSENRILYIRYNLDGTSIIGGNVLGQNRRIGGAVDVRVREDQPRRAFTIHGKDRGTIFVFHDTGDNAHRLPGKSRFYRFNKLLGRIGIVADVENNGPALNAHHLKPTRQESFFNSPNGSVKVC